MKQILRKLLLLALTGALLASCAPALADITKETEMEAIYWLSGICADGEDVLVTDTFNKVVWRVSEGEYIPAAGCSLYRDLTGAAAAYYLDAGLTDARFMEPWAIVPFLDGWAVSDAAANVVRYVDAESVQTAAGSGEAGMTDGFCLESKLNRPTGLAVDEDGCLYIADTGSGAIRKLNTEGDLSTVCTGLNRPTGLCWQNGTLYIAETGAQRILKLIDGSLSVVAGYAHDGEGGYTDGRTQNALFCNPQGLAVSADGTIYVADTDNSAIRRIRDGMVSTVAIPEDAVNLLCSPRGIFLSGNTLFCADTLSGSIVRLSIAETSYPDVNDGDWFAADVKKASEYGLLKGTDNGFEPTVITSRAMFVTILSRLQKLIDGDTIIAGDAAFPDLSESDWYADAARWAADAGIVNGVDGGLFAGNAGIQRQQLVTMLCRFAAANGLDASARTDLSAYSDAAAVQSYAADAMRWAVGVGIIDGLTDGSLAPGAFATRAQTATILIRFLTACGI